MIYLYFDRTGALVETINEKPFKQGSVNVNGLAVYCELWDDDDFELDDIWYVQKLPNGTLTNETSFVDNVVNTTIPYNPKADHKFFKDFKTYKFYIKNFDESYLSQNGLNVGTIRFSINSSIEALGEILFNVQESVIKYDNNITQSQYDYLLLAYASRTLNEETGRTIYELIEEIVKEQAKITGVEYVGTTEEILALTSDEGIALSTTNAHIYYWDEEQVSYVDSEIEFMDISLSSNVMTLSGSQTVSGMKTFTGTQVFSGTTMFSGASVHSNDVEVGGDLIAKNVIGNDGTDYALNLKSGNEENKIIVDNNKVEISHDATGNIADASVIVNSASILFKVANRSVLAIGTDEIDAIGNMYASTILSSSTLNLLSPNEENGISISDTNIKAKLEDTDILTFKIVMDEENPSLHYYHIETGEGTYLKGKALNPSDLYDIVNKNYADGIKTTLETALGGKADLNNSSQNIRANKLQANSIIDGTDTTEIEMMQGAINFYAKNWQDTSQYRVICFSYSQGLEIGEPTKSFNPTTKNYVDGIKTNLQSQIDGINAGQNLADIVADLTALNNLSTTNLQVGDKVQVLVDSNHDDGSTVYNWNGSAWVYIGKYGQDGYTKAQADTLLATKQDVIDSSHKLSSDLVDDTNATNKFATASQLSQIATNQSDISNIKDGTTLDSFADVETALSGKVDMLQADWADQVYVKKSDGTNSSYYIDFNSTPYSVCIRNATGRLNVVGALYDSQAINLGQWKNDLQVKRHFINATINDGVDNITAIISILSPISTLNTATLIKNYFKDKGYNIPSTSTYLLTDVAIFIPSTSNNYVGVVYDETNDKFVANGTNYTLVSITSETITKDILPL